MIGLRDRNWGGGLVLLGLVMMEAIWLTSFFLTLNRPVPAPHPIAILTLVLVLLLAAAGLARVLTHWHVSPRLHWGIMTGGLLLAIVAILFWRLLPVGPEQAPLRPGIGLALALLLVLAAWWRGSTLAQLDIASPNVVLVHFWIGLSVFLLTIILGEAMLGGLQPLASRDLTAAPTRGIVGFIPVYFFISLITLSLARIEEVTQLPESTASTPRLRFWLGFIPGAAVLVVAASLLLSLFFTGGGLAWTFGWFPPVLQGLGTVLEFIARIFLTILEALFGLLVPVLEWFVRILPLDRLKQMTQQLLQTIQQLQEVVRQMEENRASGDVWVSIGKYVPAILFILLVLIVGRVVRGRRRQSKRLVPRQEGRVSGGLTGAGEGNLLRQGLDRLVDRFREGLRFFYALSIRRIYADLGRLAAHNGYPRPLHQTPYEYEPLLEEAFPKHTVDVRLITQAYVSAHYGQVPDTHEELERIRSAWERIRTSD